VSRPGTPPSSHPPGLPTLFLDRSLGRIQVPTILRDAGLRVVTLAEQYGIPTDETVEDVTWLRDASTRGWAVVMKDERIRRRPAEQKAVRQHLVRCICLSRADLIAADMAKRVLNNLPAMERPAPSLGHSSMPFKLTASPVFYEHVAVWNGDALDVEIAPWASRDSAAAIAASRSFVVCW